MNWNKKQTERIHKQIQELYEQDLMQIEIANKLHISRSYVNRAIKKIKERRSMPQVPQERRSEPQEQRSEPPVPTNKDWGCLGWGLFFTSPLLLAYIIMGILSKFGFLGQGDLFSDTLIFARNVGKLILNLWRHLF